MSGKQIPQPPSITEFTNFRGQGLVRRWFPGKGAVAALWFFSTIWNGFLVFWYWLAVGGEHPDDIGFWIALIFPIGHIAVGVGLVYYLACLHLNRTEILLDGTMLSITHGPVPAGKRVAVYRAEIAQLYITEEKQTDSYGKVSIHYELRMKDTENRHRPLIKKLSSAAEALYIERYLENLLALPHEPVHGEYVPAEDAA